MAKNDKLKTASDNARRWGVAGGGAGGALIGGGIGMLVGPVGGAIGATIGGAIGGWGGGKLHDWLPLRPTPDPVSGTDDDPN